jgi:pimeloyl-ACP methyl ester carboxylesterase
MAKGVGMKDDGVGLPAGVRVRRLEGVNGLSMRVLEAGPVEGPLVLLLHGFPELAFSFRHQLVALGAAGFHAVAPDQRGYGGTTGHDAGDLSQFRLAQLAADVVALLGALGRPGARAVVGHDFGSPVAAYAALARPDLFGGVMLMSAPWGGVPPLAGVPKAPRVHPAVALGPALAALDPPRVHYQAWYASDAAAAEMDAPAQGMRAFLRAYFHMKSADWDGNVANPPRPLGGWTAEALGGLPPYYVMPADRGMAATVAPYMPGEAGCAWLSEAELDVFADAFGSTGFGPALLWYRAVMCGRFDGDLWLYAGRRIAVPGAYVAGASDWGIYQAPGAFEAMQANAFEDLRLCAILESAGHWVQQEAAGEVNRLLLEFLGGL